jgi:hypothetical protein
MRNTFAVLLLPIRLVWSLDFSHVVLELSCIFPFVNLGFDRAFIGHFSLHATAFSTRLMLDLYAATTLLFYAN